MRWKKKGEIRMKERKTVMGGYYGVMNLIRVSI